MRVRAFTLLESLLTLAVTSTLLLLLSGSVKSSFESVEQQLFFTEFEHFYTESQKLSLASQTPVQLNINRSGISNGYQHLSLPAGVRVSEDKIIRFDKAGGNSSLAKIVFETKKNKISYQLYMGNGKFKKTEG